MTLSRNPGVFLLWVTQTGATLGGELFNIGVAQFGFMLSRLALAWLADRIEVRWVYLIRGALCLASAMYALSRGTVREGRVEAWA